VPYDIGNLSNEYSETKALKSVHRHYVKENNHKAITNTRRRL
jgi:predicted HD phosphohydrolase